MFKLDIQSLEQGMSEFAGGEAIPSSDHVKVYDVEVLRTPDEVEGTWRNLRGMGFGTAVVFDYRADRYGYLVDRSGPHIALPGFGFQEGRHD